MSHCTLGLFWSRCHFVIGYYKVAQEAESEFFPQNSLIAQFDITLTYSSITHNLTQQGLEKL